jgi:UDP-glucose 4-epimerase
MSKESIMSDISIPASDLKDQTILVTGGAGFIGSHLVDGLLQRDVRQVRVLDNFANGKWENLDQVSSDRRLAVYEQDLLNGGVAGMVCRDVNVVFHLACLGVRHSLHAPLHNHRVNAEGTLLLLEAARQAGVRRFVYVSTSEVYGTARYAPMDEEHPTRPMTVYGGSKLAGESYARAYFETYGFPTVMIRPFNNFGPRSHFEGDAGEVIPRFLLRALAGQPPIIFGDGTQTRDFIFVTDTVRALIESASNDRCIGQTLNVGSGTEISVNELARWAIEASGQRHLKPQYQPPRPGDVLRLCADTSKFQALTGFQPRVSMVEGLARVAAWFRMQSEAEGILKLPQPVRNWEAA